MNVKECYEKRFGKGSFKVALKIRELAKKEVIDDIKKLNKHPLKKDGCVYIEINKSDIDDLEKHHHLKKEDEEVAR